MSKLPHLGGGGRVPALSQPLGVGVGLGEPPVDTVVAGRRAGGLGCGSRSRSVQAVEEVIQLRVTAVSRASVGVCGCVGG